MNRLEVFHVEDEHDIEDVVNEYCVCNGFNPISINLTYLPIVNNWLVAVIVELPEEDDEQFV